MQGTQDSSRAPTDAHSLEDRLRDMITSHQPHQPQHNRPPAYPALPSVRQSMPPPPQYSQRPNGPPPTYVQSNNYSAHPIPLRPPPGLAGVGSRPRTTGPPQFGPGHQQRRSQGGPSMQQPTQGPDAPSSSPRYQQPRRGWGNPAPLAPPPPSLDHFPPLGKENPEGKQRSPHSVPSYQRADQPHGQQPHRPKAGPLASNNNPIAPRRFDRRPPRLPVAHYEQFFVEQAANLEKVAKSLLEEISPPDEETVAKNELLHLLQGICRKLVPTAVLIPFGSLVTGFSTASSDIDCVFVAGPLNDPATPEVSDDLPALLERSLQEEDFDAQLLTRTRVPIIKMKQRAAPGIGEIQCDIGFKNFLAIHNTQLLLCYSKCDVRVKQIVLFVKWWAKNRHINSPYRGTLSSYGYVLMILHYLINIVQPPVLPNLQLQPIPQGTADSEIHYKEGGSEYNIWFAKDITNIGPSPNTSSAGELLRGFFDYYSYKFAWGQSVISIRTQGGLLTKQDKDWCMAKSRPANTSDGAETWEVKDRYLFALEDPFETVHNVGRTCNGPGVRRIRDELRRAMDLIKFRGDGGQRLERFLCEEAPPERPFVKKEDREPKDPNASMSPGAENENAAEEAANSGAAAGGKAAEDLVLDTLDAVKELSLNS